MESPMLRHFSVNKICDVELPLIGLDLPDKITISHQIPEACLNIAKDRQYDNTGDLVLIIGKRKVYAHKEVLNLRIPYFHSLFNSTMAECVKGEVNISSEFCASIDDLLGYSYTGVLIITTENVQDLMIAANFFQIEPVMDECGQFMRRRLTIDNVLSLHFLCQSIAYLKINYFLMNFVDKNFVPLSMTPQFLELSIDDLVEILQRDSLNIDEEAQVFHAAHQWIGESIDRRIHATRLLRCIRCTHLSLAFITNTLEMTDWLVENSDCTNILQIAKEYIMGKDDKAHLIFDTSERVCDEANKLFVANSSDGIAKNKPATSLHIYNPLTDTWKKWENNKLPHQFIDDLAFFDNKIYFTCGLRDPKIFAVFDSSTNEWHTENESITVNMPPITGFPARSNWDSAKGVMDKRVYVAGGRDDDMNAVSAMESFDSQSQIPCQLTPMTKGRACAAYTVLDRKLYVIGGVDSEDNCLNDGECYDPEANKWNCISPMKYKRKNSTGAVLNGQIYVVGGVNENDVLSKEVERYNPVDNTWTTLARMNTARADAKIGTSCGKLFIFGGFDNWKRITKARSIEMYDPDTDIWENREPLPELIHCIAVPVSASIPSSVANLEALWINKFRKFRLKEELIRAIVECGFMNPMTVQSQCLPHSIQGQDVIIQSKSRSGKTSCLVLSTLQQVDPIEEDASVLVLCPTGKLAKQTDEMFQNLSKYLPEIKKSVFTGDIPLEDDKISFEKSSPHILIGTPSRILKLIQSHANKLNLLKCIILDGCDRMIGDYKELDDIENILNNISNEKQVMVSTITFPKRLRTFCTKYMRSEDHTFTFSMHLK